MQSSYKIEYVAIKDLILSSKILILRSKVLSCNVTAIFFDLFFAISKLIDILLSSHK